MASWLIKRKKTRVSTMYDAGLFLNKVSVVYFTDVFGL